MPRRIKLLILTTAKKKAVKLILHLSRFASSYLRYVIDYAVLTSDWHMSPIVLGDTVILIVETWEFNDPDADVAAIIAGL